MLVIWGANIMENEKKVGSVRAMMLKWNNPNVVINPEVLKNLRYERAMIYNENRESMGCPKGFFMKAYAKMKSSRVFQDLQSYRRKFSFQKIAAKFLQTVGYLQKIVDDTNNSIVKNINGVIRNVKAQYINKIAKNVDERFGRMQKGEEDLVKVPVPVQNSRWQGR